MAVPVATGLIRTLLRIERRLRAKERDNFGLVTADTFLNLWSSATSLIFAVLLGVVGLSLVVGGIVIMNIMLMTVTERTREIGLRMAVGARGRDVLRKFLLEAIVLGMMGGLIGVALGMAGTRTIADVFQWPTRVSQDAIAMAVFFSAAIGILFGYYPARRAARLDPIEALRHE